MSNSPHLALTLVQSAQAQKEVTVNQSFVRIDAILGSGAMDKDLSTSPGSPSDGDVYIVGPGATGDWVGKEDNVAYYSAGWKFVSPKEGLTLWLNDENILYTYKGDGWVPTVGSHGIGMSGTQLFDVEIKNYSETKVDVTATATTVIDIAYGNVFKLDQAVDITTLTIQNAGPSTTASGFRLYRIKDNSGTTRTITWPASIKWAGGAAPTLTQTANAVDAFQFTTLDGGTTWYANTIGTNFA